ncbi:YncE family protein [Schinkia azotoformans]|nr:YncE family protein [Schinkia azotoformans]MEC1742791.1 YncE family protein [Schinkia azotoformans]MEC1769036.1 YncE family protein [Schinkia azotoformans]MEC1789621.1 YncE family protein [Schinkia azotoformans]MED4378446.1 YncE family protein [Schinkia azotoformans]MED4417411.1 YncE family protein [Schinkia azotoformans]
MSSSLILAACGTDQSNTAAPENKEPQQEQAAQEEKVTTGNYYFTANEGGSINKIDAATNEVVETITVDGAVHNVQVSPDGKIVGATLVPGMGHGEEGNDESAEHNDEHAEAADDHGDSGADAGHSEGMNGLALFYDAQTNALIKEVQVGNHPAHIVFTSNGQYALVTNNEDNNVSVIDINTFTVTNTVETGKGPHGFRISADDKFAYIANMGEDTVSVINLESFTEEKKIQVGPTPVTTGVTSDGKTLVTTLNSENNLAIVDLSTDQVTKVEVGVGPAQVYIQADNKFAFVANQGTAESPSTSITKVDLDSKTAVATIETGKGAHGVVVSPDNKYVYVTNMFENTVSVIDNEQNKVIQTIDVGEIPNGISIMP